jgi:hypothetical protein
MYKSADHSGRAVYGVGLRLFACWNCGFESRQGHRCLSPVSVVCYQVEVSASGLITHPEDVVCLSVIVKSR